MTAQPLEQLEARSAADDVAVEAVQQPADVNTEGDTVQGWRVTDERAAAWAIARIRQTRSRLAAAIAPAQLQLHALEDRADQLRRDIAALQAAAQADEDFFAARLTEWHEARFDADPKHCVSIKLPGGTLKSNAGQLRVEVDNDQAAHADDHEHAFSEQVVKIDKRALLAYFKSTGHKPAGVRVVPAARRFWVEVS